jgi:hypothetical protein
MAFCLTAAFCGCTSTRGESNTADTQEISSEAETEATEVTTEATTTEDTTTVTETETTKLIIETTAPDQQISAADSNIVLTHITEGGEGLGVFHQLSGNIRGTEMQNGADYKGWKLTAASGHAEADETIAEASASFTYGEAGGFSVNGTVEVLPADHPQYPNMMYFHSDDVDAFPKFMDDNRGEANRAKFIIENSSDVYRMLEKDDPPAETAFSVSVTVSAVTVRYAADGSAYDTIVVKAASNR